MSVDHNYVLYGSYASYYTAKTRSYLRKKGIPFVERLPSDPRFRNYVRPQSGSHRIPQLETPEAEVVQDSTEIFDLLEGRFPEIPALPNTPRQRFVAHLMELLGSEGLVRLAWQYRWFPEDNLQFVKMDFGRSFRPQGTDEELLHYGNLIADRMLSRGKVSFDDELLAQMQTDYLGLLQRLEAHMQSYPFMLGGHPSAADYSLMGALHAHMGRDPVPLHLQQMNAPRVFRWVEHMMTPEIQSPEFAEYPIEYASNDEIPDTFKEVLRYLLDLYGERFLSEGQAYEAYVDQRDLQPGSMVDEEDQPMLVQEIDGKAVHFGVLNVWLLQRSLSHYAAQDAEGQASIVELMSELGWAHLLGLEISHPPTRTENRFYVG